MARSIHVCGEQTLTLPECNPCDELEARVQNLEDCCDDAQQTFTEHEGRIATVEEEVTDISNEVNGLDSRISANESGITDLDTNKQDKLIAGENIEIDGNEISAIPSEYTGGNNITIDSNNVISTPSYTGVGNVSVSSDKKISVDLSDYYTSDRVYTKQEVDDLIGQGFEFVPVDTLPSTGQASKIYLVKTSDPNVRDMYVYNGGTWKKIGSTGVQLSGVVRTTGTRETYDEHIIRVWYGDGTGERLQILGIGWTPDNTIATNDGYGSNSPGADTGGSVTP